MLNRPEEKSASATEHKQENFKDHLNRLLQEKLKLIESETQSKLRRSQMELSDELRKAYSAELRKNKQINAERKEVVDTYREELSQSQDSAAYYQHVIEHLESIIQEQDEIITEASQTIREGNHTTDLFALELNNKDAQLTELFLNFRFLQLALHKTCHEMSKQQQFITELQTLLKGQQKEDAELLRELARHKRTSDAKISQLFRKSHEQKQTVLRAEEIQVKLEDKSDASTNEDTDSDEDVVVVSPVNPRRLFTTATPPSSPVSESDSEQEIVERPSSRASV